MIFTEADFDFLDDDQEDLSQKSGQINVEHLKECGLIVSVFRIDGLYEISIIDNEESYVVECADDVESAMARMEEWVWILRQGLARVFDISQQRMCVLVPLVYEEQGG